MAITLEKKQISFMIWTGSNLMQPKPIQVIHQSILNGITLGEHDSWHYLPNMNEKDKTGKEIYEGHILLGPFANHMSSNNLKTKTMLFMVKNEGPCLTYLPFEPLGQYRYYPDFDQCKIVGHFYTHPELLTPQSKQ